MAALPACAASRPRTALTGPPRQPLPCHVHSLPRAFLCMLLHGQTDVRMPQRKPGLPLSVPRAPSLSEVISSNWSDPVIAQGSPSSGRAPSTSETSEGIVTLAQKTCGSKATLTAQGGKRRKQTSKCQVPLHCLPPPSCLCGGRKDTCILLGNKEPTLAEKSNTQRQAFLFFFTGGNVISRPFFSSSHLLHVRPKNKQGFLTHHNKDKN